MISSVKQPNTKLQIIYNVSVVEPSSLKTSFKWLHSGAPEYKDEVFTNLIVCFTIPTSTSIPTLHGIITPSVTGSSSSESFSSTGGALVGLMIVIARTVIGSGLGVTMMTSSAASSGSLALNRDPLAIDFYYVVVEPPPGCQTLGIVAANVDFGISHKPAIHISLNTFIRKLQCAAVDNTQANHPSKQQTIQCHDRETNRPETPKVNNNGKMLGSTRFTNLMLTLSSLTSFDLIVHNRENSKPLEV
uniref:Uncharacterized protein n=1 Tax=Glossina palpalis gambiensis TaxID=67801 RepID=A0A1B0B1W4_9MUSC